MSQDWKNGWNAAVEAMQPAAKGLDVEAAAHLAEFGCNVYHRGAPCRWSRLASQPAAPRDPTTRGGETPETMALATEYETGWRHGAADERTRIREWAKSRIYPAMSHAESLGFFADLLTILAAEGEQPIEYGQCGDLRWTVEKWGRVTHKHNCPNRVDPWCQSHPEGCEGEQP